MSWVWYTSMPNFVKTSSIILVSSDVHAHTGLYKVGDFFCLLWLNVCLNDLLFFCLYLTILPLFYSYGTKYKHNFHISPFEIRTALIIPFCSFYLQRIKETILKALKESPLFSTEGLFNAKCPLLKSIRYCF